MLKKYETYDKNHKNIIYELRQRELNKVKQQILSLQQECKCYCKCYKNDIRVLLGLCDISCKEPCKERIQLIEDLNKKTKSLQETINNNLYKNNKIINNKSIQ